MLSRWSFSSCRLLSQHCDVAIVGGGPVGNALAVSIGNLKSGLQIALAHNEWLKDKKVVVLEAGQPQRLGAPPKNYSNRVFACNPASVQLFKDLQIWEVLKNYRVKELSALYVMDACSRSKVEFNPTGGTGHLIEDDAITKALYGKILDSCPNVEFRTKVKDLSNTATLKLEDGSELNALLVVGADGARSGVRKAMGVQTTAFDYDQMAIVCTLEVKPNGPNEIAWQRFTPLGPIALLPLTDDLCSLVWTSTTADAKRLLNLSAEEFVEELNHYMSDLVNKVLDGMDKLAQILRFSPLSPPKTPPLVLKMQADTRGAFPLGFSHSHTYVKPRAALIGDAAHRVHPLAGQGVNLGWSDVRVLTQTLERATRDGSDIGSLTYLADFDSQSQRHNVPVMVSVDWLNRLYHTTFSPLVLLRSAGLHAIDNVRPVRDFIVARASH